MPIRVIINGEIKLQTTEIEEAVEYAITYVIQQLKTGNPKIINAFKQFNKNKPIHKHEERSLLRRFALDYLTKTWQWRYW